jgi:hypothetical protein
MKDDVKIHVATNHSSICWGFEWQMAYENAAKSFQVSSLLPASRGLYRTVGDGRGKDFGL